MQVDVRVQEPDFDAAAEYAALRKRLGAGVGAVASFIGLVRELHPGPAGDATVEALHLEHYPGMTERSIEAIIARAAARWPLLDVVVIHRVGRLDPGAQIVFVQVASAHRGAAFGACELVMDYLKTEAVFWKREDTARGSRWVEATGEDRARVSDRRGDA
ncbi:MAG: molybdenum cofactor biosynthesis protein MoaE [Pseudomonadales bacterium]